MIRWFPLILISRLPRTFHKKWIILVLIRNQAQNILNSHFLSMFAMSFHLLIFLSLVAYFSSTKCTDANPGDFVNIFWSLGWDNIHFFQSVNCRQKRVGCGMDLPCMAATVHYWTCSQSLGILGCPFSDTALFYFCFLLLINKLQIKLWKLHVSSRPLVSLDASDSEALETPIRTVLTFKKRN